MNGFRRDPGLDTLLDLDGQVYVVDPTSNHCGEVFCKTSGTVARTTTRTQLFAHATRGRRRALVGFDNAHHVRASSRPGGRARQQHDHKHRFRTIRPYEYKDAAALLSDFWSEVDAVLEERGILR